MTFSKSDAGLCPPDRVISAIKIPVLLHQIQIFVVEEKMQKEEEREWKE